MEQQKSKVYIQIDENNLIRRCEGGYTMENIQNIEDWIFVDEGFGDRYNLCQSHYFPGGLYTTDGIPRFIWDGVQVVERTEEAIAADRTTRAEEERRAEKERVDNATETVLLEMASEQEERICMLEMGVSDNDL